MGAPTTYFVSRYLSTSKEVPRLHGLQLDYIKDASRTMRRDCSQTIASWWAWSYIEHATHHAAATSNPWVRCTLLSFDIQSLRYTSDQFVDVAEERKDIEEVFYIRPEGIYESRNGKGYAWSVHDRLAIKKILLSSCKFYNDMMKRGIAPEHARHLIPACYLQNAVVTGNLRAWMHVFDMRSKINAQIEIQTLAEMMILELQKWCPEIMGWWRKTRERKGLLAP